MLNSVKIYVHTVAIISLWFGHCASLQIRERIIHYFNCDGFIRTWRWSRLHFGSFRCCTFVVIGVWGRSSPNTEWSKHGNNRKSLPLKR